MVSVEHGQTPFGALAGGLATATEASWRTSFDRTLSCTHTGRSRSQRACSTSSGCARSA